MTIGARVFKTGLAVSVALYICTLLKFEPSIFAAVAAIFAIQPSIYRSWLQILDQLQTNVLGAAVAIAAGTMFGNDPIAVGVVCIIVILICIRIKMESTIALTLVTVVAIMEAPGQEWHYAFNRFLIILVGMGSSFAVNLIVFPPKHKKQFMDKLNESFNRLSLLLRTAISNEMKESVSKTERQTLQDTLLKLEERYTMFEEERVLFKQAKFRHSRRLVLYKQMLTTLEKGAEIVNTVNEHFFRTVQDSAITLIYDRQIEDLIKYHEHILLKYEGKIKADGGESTTPDSHSGAFLEEALAYISENSLERRRLIVVASAIYEYGFQLERLDKTVENELKQRERKSG